MLVLTLSIAAAAGFVVAALLAQGTIGMSRTFHHLSVVIAAGILLGVAFSDLVPESLELLGSVDAALAIAVGFLVLFLVEALTGGHTHHHEPHGHDAHSHGHAHAHAHSHAPAPVDADACVPTHAVLPFLIGLSIHNLADGLAIGASHEVSDTTAAGIAIGILVHQLPVGISFAAVLLASNVGVRRMRRDAILVGALIPVGTAVVLLAPDLAGTTLGALIGVAAGSLLYIATGHLLPEAQSEERRPGIAAAFTVSLIGTVLLLGSFHDAAHGDEHADEQDEAPHAAAADDS